MSRKGQVPRSTLNVLSGLTNTAKTVSGTSRKPFSFSKPPKVRGGVPALYDKIGRGGKPQTKPAQWQVKSRQAAMPSPRLQKADAELAQANRRLRVAQANMMKLPQFNSAMTQLKAERMAKTPIQLMEARLGDRLNTEAGRQEFAKKFQAMSLPSSKGLVAAASGEADRKLSKLILKENWKKLAASAPKEVGIGGEYNREQARKAADYVVNLDRAQNAGATNFKEAWQMYPDLVERGVNYGVRKAQRTSAGRAVEGAAEATGTAIQDFAKASGSKKPGFRGATIATNPFSNPIAQFGLNVGGQALRSPSATLKTVAVLPEAVIGGLGQVAYDTGSGVLAGDPLRGPIKAAKQAAGDISERYGPLAAGDYAEYQKRLRKRGDVTPEILDAFTVATLGGTVAGRAIGAAGRRGKLGPNVERLLTEPRPRLKVTANLSKEQDLSKNAFRALGQRAEDWRRNAQAVKIAAKETGNKRTDSLRDRAKGKRTYTEDEHSTAEGAGGLIPEPGEVVALQKPLGLSKLFNNQDRLARKELGRISTENRIRGDKSKARVVEPNRDLYRGLTNREQKAAHLAVQGTLAVLEDGTFDIARSVKALEMHRAEIEAERKAVLEDAIRVEKEGGKPVAAKQIKILETRIPALKDRFDEIRAIDAILKDPEKALTPRLAERSAVFREAVGDITAGVKDSTAARRKALTQAEFLKYYKSTSPEIPSTAMADEIASLEKELEDHRDWMRSDSRNSATDEELEAQLRRADEATERLQELRTQASPVASSARYADDPLDRSAEIEAQIAALEGEKKSKERDEEIRTLQDDLLANKERYDQEFADEVARQAKELGLPANPAYFKHFGIKRDSSSAYTTGARPTVDAKLYKTNLVLFKLGLYDMSAAALEYGLMQSVKTAMKSYYTTEIVEKMALRKLAGQEVPTNLKQIELVRWLANHNLDPNRFMFFNPKAAFSDEVLLDEGSSRFINPDALVDGKDIVSKMKDPQIEAMLRMDPGALANRDGWYVIPREAGGGDLERAIRGAGPANRVWDKVRGGSSWLILGLSPAWLIWQRVVEAYSFAVAHSLNPAAMMKAVVRYRHAWAALSPDMRETIDLGIGGGFYQRTPKMGKIGREMANRSTTAQYFFTTWEKLSRNTVVEKGKELPFVLFKLDEAFNRQFRRMEFLSETERQMFRKDYDELRKNVGETHAALDRAMKVLRKPPAQRFEDALEDAKVFDRAAERVMNLYGDFQNRSAKERYGWASIPLFYTFLRFATRLLFYTLPVRHPNILALSLQLARLHKEELDEYYGQEIPSWGYSNVLSDQKGKDGHKRVINLARISPVTGLSLDGAQFLLSILAGQELGKGPRALLTSLPSPVTAAIEATLGQSLLTGAPLKIGSDPKNSDSFKEGGGGSWFRTTLARALQSNPILAATTLLLSKGRPFSDDSLPWDIIEPQYKSERGRKQAEEKAARKGSPERRSAYKLLGGLVPQDDPTFGVLEAQRKREKSGKGRAKSTSPFDQFMPKGQEDPFKEFKPKGVKKSPFEQFTNPPKAQSSSTQGASYAAPSSASYADSMPVVATPPTPTVSEPVSYVSDAPSQKTISGKTSWFGGPNDRENTGTALGLPDTVRGLAVYNQSTLGGYWRVRWPNGRVSIERQVDIGPAPWTGRKIDFTSAAIRANGYTEQNFPTDSRATIEYLGKNKPSQQALPSAASSSSPRATSASSKPVGASLFKNSLIGSPFKNDLTGAVPLAPQPETTAPAASTAASTTASVAASRGTVTGVPLSNPTVRDVVSQIAGIYGKPVTVSSGKRSTKYTSSGNVSDHYTGNAADLAASGTALTRLGQSALIAAGMSPAQAKKQTGGVFNLNKNGKRYQIIFNSNVGGNHYNHLHIGVK